MTEEDMRQRVGLWVHENMPEFARQEWAAFLDSVVQAIERSGIAAMSDADVMRLDHCMKAERLDMFVTESLAGTRAWREADASEDPALQAHADKWVEHLSGNGDGGTDIERDWALRESLKR